MLRWFFSLHSPVHNYSISPEKIGGQSAAKKPKAKGKAKAAAPPADEDELPTFGQPSTSNPPAVDADASPYVSSVPPITVLEKEDGTDEIPTMPLPFTPSIKKTLNKPGVNPGFEPVPLPDGLSVAVLKTRLDGKKKIKCVYVLSG